MPTRIASNIYSKAKDDSVTRSIYNYDSTAQDTLRYNNENPSNVAASPDLTIKDVRGIFGIPYQFLDTVDPRITGTSIGAKYAEKIVGRMPLLFLTPCKQKFMSGYDNQDKSNVLTDLINKEGTGSDFLNSELSKNGRYYTCEFKWPEYYKYVNTLCGMMASYMGIENVKIPTNKGEIPISKINWATDLSNTELDTYFNAKRAVVFYVDGQSVSEMSETFNNNTTESSLASTLNGYSEQINEIKFLLGEDSSLLNMVTEAGEELSKGIISGLSDAFSNLSGGMLADLAQKGSSTVLSGGKLVFPKIWQDSSFSRSYSFTIKLRSPDHDNLSIFLNIMVPYLHILALTLPVSHEDYANSYNAPFLVKGYCKGLFNINDGIITDLSVTRGAECQWNDDGLPTQMDLSISIEDLYSSLFMSSLNNSEPPILLNKLKDSFSVVQNTAMMDYLANLAGFNLADEEMLRSVKMLMKISSTTFRQAGNDIYNRFDRAITNMIKRLYF